MGTVLQGYHFFFVWGFVSASFSAVAFVLALSFAFGFDVVRDSTRCGLYHVSPSRVAPCDHQRLKPALQCIRVPPGEHQPGVRNAGVQRNHRQQTINKYEIDDGPYPEVREALLPNKNFRHGNAMLLARLFRHCEGVVAGWASQSLRFHSR